MGSSHYRPVGWHNMVHELLHRFGATDIYQGTLDVGDPQSRELEISMDQRYGRVLWEMR
ncbi:hypothetical protein J4430_02725 [Candidatus Woesearchaeota archaeon]|nr:hypothetical protein [Candidatus Woesearchaeota archaeon]